MNNGEMQFEVWFERKEYSKIFENSEMVVPKDQYFLGYYNSLDEIIDAFNEEDYIFGNSTIKSIIYATNSVMKAVTRLMRRHLPTFYPFEITPKDLNSIKIIDLFNKDKINSVKEVLVTNYGVKDFEEIRQTQEFSNWKLSVDKRTGMLIWVPSDSSEGIVVNMTISHYITGWPLNVTVKIGSCSENVFSFSFKKLQEIIFGKENKAPIITSKILLNKKRIFELLSQGKFENEFPSETDYGISFKLFKGSSKSKKVLATIVADANIEAWNSRIHKEIDEGKIKKLIISNGIFEFIDLTEEDKEVLHKYYEWHGKEKDGNANK